jgi:hypothetical protein
MSRDRDYGIKQVSANEYQVMRLTEPFPGPIASILQIFNRRQQAAGWRFKPRVTLQGSRSKIWQTPAEARAATKLMALREAKASIAEASITSD